MEECIFDYIALHFKCQFNNLTSSVLLFNVFAGWESDKNEWKETWKMFTFQTEKFLKLSASMRHKIIFHFIRVFVLILENAFRNRIVKINQLHRSPFLLTSQSVMIFPMYCSGNMSVPVIIGSYKPTVFTGSGNYNNEKYHFRTNFRAFTQKKSIRV